MSELTDEQLRGVVLSYDKFRDSQMYRMATELIARRAERAKPTQSDVERALDLCGVGCGCTEEQSETCGFFREGLCHQMPDSISAAFASIRAGGSAERAKLEAADVVECVSYLRWWLGMGQYDEGSKLATSISCLLALAQPAESGATEQSPAVKKAMERFHRRCAEVDAGAKP